MIPPDPAPRPEKADFAAKRAKSIERKAKRAARIQDNAALGFKVARKVKKVPKATIRKRLIKALDKAFSLAVRAKCSKCTFCGGPVDHCFHYVTRAKYSVRWDERNATGSCAGCNYRYEFDPHFAISYFIAFHGLPAYEQLIRDGNIISKHSNEDLEKRLLELSPAL